MGRKNNIEDIHLELISAEPFNNDRFSGVCLSWQSDIGFGQYEIYKAKDSNQWVADTETMDFGEDKDFGRKLLQLWMDEVVIY